MKKFTVLTLSLSLSLSLLKADYWTQKANLTGGMRYVAVSFSIGDKGYVGTGNNITTYFQDFWEYDPVTNTWTQKANFPGDPRYFACGFSLGSKGYIGLGQSPSGYYQDFWAYTPATNSWAQIADFGGGARGFQPTAFSLDGYGYVGLGFNGVDKQDFWQYDTLLNTWTQKANFGGAAMEQAISFTVGNKAYVGTGETSVPTYAHRDFWEYDPLTDSWMQLANFPGTARFSASAFSIGQYGYVGTGYDSAYVQHYDFYQYSIATNSWTQKADIGTIARSHAVGFTIGAKGYIGTGLGTSGNLGDWWEYTPDSTTGIADFGLSNSDSDFKVYPNPTSEFIVISAEFAALEKIEISIADVNNKEVYVTKFETKTLNLKLQTLNFSTGIYFVTIDNGKEKVVKKFIKN